jgi:F0F1-type ATP synthase membrane subunit b/b'
MKRLLRATLLAGFLTAIPVAYLHAQETTPAKEEPVDENLTWKWINFAILAAGLGYLIVKTLPPYFRSRTIDIQKGIAEAQAQKADAEKRAAQMEARLAALGTEIEKFRAEARAEMEQEGKRITEETERQMKRLEQQVQVEIETAAKNARRELKTYAAKLSLDLAEQRIRTRLDQSTEAGLIDDFVKDLEASRN